MSRVFRNDTARLIVEFRDYKGNTIKPMNISLTIYDERENVIVTIESSGIKQEDNIYFYDYTHSSRDNYIFEFKGMYENLPVLCRQFVEVAFV
ncbi:hypothetical protein [Lysinibacillus sp. NPDC093216]|uniref:hypothetical protein n=2 Tax=unclassified Lysinibacillus TaxID=2636778 RepID=UPI003D04C7D9